MTGRSLVSLSAIDLDRAHLRPLAAPEPDSRPRLKFLERLRVIMRRIPAVERDVVELYFFMGKRQETIARILGVTQQAVSHRLHMALRRLAYLIEQPDVQPARMVADLRGLLTDARLVRVLCDLARTSSTLTTARNLNTTQQAVTAAFETAMELLRGQTCLDAIFYSAYFEHVSSHLNVLYYRRGHIGREAQSQGGQGAAESADARAAAG